MNKNMKKKILAVVACAIAIPSVLGVASLTSAARVVGAIQGTGATPADQACFVIIDGTITNGCAGPATFLMSLHIDTAGVKTPIVNGFFPIGGALQCASLAQDKAGNYIGSSSWIPFPTANVDADLTLTSVAVPTNGMVTVACQMSAGAELHTVRW